MYLANDKENISKITMQVLREMLNDYPSEFEKKNCTNPLYIESWSIVQRAVKKAKEFNISVVTTVLDSSAQVILSYRMEDALLVSNDMAFKKAYTAVGMKMQSKELGKLTQQGQWLHNLEMMLDNKIVSLPGGIPIFDGQRLLGSIGVSGGNGEQDQEIASFAINLNS